MQSNRPSIVAPGPTKPTRSPMDPDPHKPPEPMRPDPTQEPVPPPEDAPEPQIDPPAGPSEPPPKWVIYIFAGCSVPPVVPFP